MGHEIVQIDAFASRAFAGNPAAVCVVDALDDPEWMQRVATEMNLSETAFVRARGDGAYDLKWFTPVREVELCGHATLAAAHALLEAGMAREGETLRFQTLSGELIARIGAAGMLEIDLPARPVKKGNEPKGLREAVGMAFAYAGRNSLGYELVELESAEAVRRVSPNSGGLKRIDMMGVVVTAAGDDGRTDFVSRFFCPAVGIEEDPVCGSAHCTLGPYWAGKMGKSELRAYQASARGGELRVVVRGDVVTLGGRCVTTLRGELTDAAAPSKRASGVGAP